MEKTLEEIRDGYREWFLQDISQVGRLVIAGNLTRLIDKIEAVEIDNTQSEEQGLIN